MKRLFNDLPASQPGLAQPQSLYGMDDGFVPYKQSALVI